MLSGTIKRTRKYWEGDGSMSQLPLGVMPLFQTSLRDWQASWKANQARERPGSAHPTARQARLSRRSPKPSGLRRGV